VRDGEERLRAILETAVAGIITINERGLIGSFISFPQG
jgi:PAS domain-containing protein